MHVVAVKQAPDALDQVIHVAEGPGLRSVAVDGERAPAQRLHTEVGHHSSVVGSHPRPEGVEDAHDACLQPVIAVIRHGHGFGKALRLVVHSSRPHRVHLTDVRLGLGMYVRVTVDLRRRCEQEAGVLRLSESKRLVRTQRAHLQRLDRKLKVVDRAGRRGKMEYPIQRPRDINELGDVVLIEAEMLVLGQVADILGRPRNEVVQTDDVVAIRQEPVGQVGAQKPGHSRDQEPHVNASRPSG